MSQTEVLTISHSPNKVNNVELAQTESGNRRPNPRGGPGEFSTYADTKNKKPQLYRHKLCDPLVFATPGRPLNGFLFVV